MNQGYLRTEYTYILLLKIKKCICVGKKSHLIKLYSLYDSNKHLGWYILFKLTCAPAITIRANGKKAAHTQTHLAVF